MLHDGHDLFAFSFCLFSYDFSFLVFNANIDTPVY